MEKDSPAPAPEAPRKSNRALLEAAVSLYIPGFLLALGVALVAPIAPVYATSFGVNFALASLVVTGTAIGKGMMDIPSGIIADRFGRRKPVLLAPLIIVVASVFAGLSQQFWELVACRFIEGIGLSIWDVTRRTIIVDEFPPAVRARMMSSFLVVTTFGTAMGPVVGAVIATTYGDRAVFFSYAIVSLFAFFGLLLFIKETKRASIGQRKSVRESIKFISDLGTYKLTFFLVAIGFMINTLRQASNNTLFPLFGKFVIHATIPEVGIGLSVFAIVQLLTQLPAAFIADKLGRKRAIVPSQAISGLAGVLMFFANDYTQVLAIMVVAGVGAGMSGGAVSAVVGDLAPAESRGAFLGVWVTLGDVGQATGPLVFGIMADAYGLRLPFIVAGAFLLASAFTIQVFAKETLKKHKADLAAK